MTQLWFNAWKHVKDGRISTEGSAVHSYDEAMQDLEDYGSSWRRHGYEYFCTYCHTINADGSHEVSVVHDLADELEQWIFERERDAREYRAAATLSASQLCNVGRSW